MEKKLSQNSPEELIKGYEKYIEDKDHGFMSSFAHDSKNPLGIIELSIGLLEDKLEKLLENSEEKLQKKVSQLIGNTLVGLDRCKVIIDDSLVLQRISNTTQKEEIELRPYIDRFFIFTKNNIKSVHGQVENHIEGGESILVVPHLFAHAFTNALIHISNSIKTEGGVIFKITHEKDTLNVEVSSQGEESIVLIDAETLSTEILNLKFEKSLERLNASFDIGINGNIVTGKLTLK